MGIMGAKQEEDDGNAQEEFLRRSILRPMIDLFPHVEVVEGARVEVKGDAAHVVEHDIGAHHVGDVGQGPRHLLRYPRKGIVEDLEADDEDDVDRPRPYIFDSYILIFHSKEVEPAARSLVDG